MDKEQALVADVQVLAKSVCASWSGSLELQLPYLNTEGCYEECT